MWYKYSLKGDFTSAFLPSGCSNYEDKQYILRETVEGGIGDSD
ncbi:MAG: hypothetical protein ACJAWA_000662 [Nonlabens sp.]|jgi:hypothetical protein